MLAKEVMVVQLVIVSTQVPPEILCLVTVVETPAASVVVVETQVVQSVADTQVAHPDPHELHVPAVESKK